MGEGILHVRMSALFGAKTSDFSKFMVCPNGQGGRRLSQYKHFVDKGGVNFSRFCADVLSVRTLI